MQEAMDAFGEAAAAPGSDKRLVALFRAGNAAFGLKRYQDALRYYDEVIKGIAEASRKASRTLVGLPSGVKSQALKHMAASLRQAAPFLRQENAKDLEAAEKAGLSRAMIDRLSLSDAVIDGMAGAIEEIAELPDPVGTITGMTRFIHLATLTR